PDLARLVALGGAAGVADVREGQGDDLARVRGVGQDFLVAGHRRVEHDLANGTAGRADGNAFEHRADLEREACGWGHWRSPTWGCRTPPARHGPARRQVVQASGNVSGARPAAPARKMNPERLEQVAQPPGPRLAAVQAARGQQRPAREHVATGGTVDQLDTLAHAGELDQVLADHVAG